MILRDIRSCSLTYYIGISTIDGSRLQLRLEVTSVPPGDGVSNLMTHNVQARQWVMRVCGAAIYGIPILIV